MRFAGVDSDTGSCPPSFAIERAESLAAANRGGAILRARLVDHRDIPEILACEIRAEHEFGRAGPVAEVFRQHRGAGNVALARGIVDGAVGAHQSGKELFGFAGARKATADADLLPRRRRGDFEPGGASEPDHRIGLGIVHPSRAAVERHLKTRRVGLAAAADPACRLHHDHLAVRRHDPPRRSNAGRTRTDHHDVGVTRHRRGNGATAKRRHGREGCGRRQEVAAGHCHVMVSEA